MSYPRIKYHPTCPDGVICHSKEQDDELGPDWTESPANIDKPICAEVIEFEKPSVIEESQVDLVIEEKQESLKPSLIKRNKKGKVI